jgi:hypothetical protein
MLFREMMAVHSQNHMKLINTLCGRNAELLLVKEGGYVFFFFFVSKCVA